MIERLAHFLPTQWTLFFAKWGLWAYDTYGSISYQFWRTYTAFMSSFMDEIVGWPLDSPYPIVLTDYYSRGVYFYDIDYYTKFNLSSKQIVFVDNTKSNPFYEPWKNPYLSVSILENDKEIANMSDWLETIKVYSYKETEYFVPLFVLLLCYAYENNLSLKYSDINKYRFSVITMSGDFETVDVRGNKISVVLDEKSTDSETKI